MELGQLGNPHKLLVLVLGVDRLLPALLPPHDSRGQLADHGDDLGGLVGGVVLEVGGPGRGQSEVGVQHPEAEEEAGTGQERGRRPGEVVLQQGELDEVLNRSELVRSAAVTELRETYLGQSVFLHVNIASLGVPPQEVKRERPGEVEAESVEDPQLHLTDLPGSVGVVGDVDKVVDLRCVHLLHLASQEHGSHANKLQLVTFDGVSLGLRKTNYNYFPTNPVIIIACKNLSIT